MKASKDKQVTWPDLTRPQRGRNLADVLEQYNRHVKPAFDYYIAPGMAHADLIVPRGGENEVAINLIVQHVQTQMDQVWTLTHFFGFLFVKTH